MASFMTCWGDRTTGPLLEVATPIIYLHASMVSRINVVYEDLLKQTEIWCQHPRWLMKSRHERTGPVSPCSVYMQHSQANNLTLYVISGDRIDSCITDVQQQLGHPKFTVNCEQAPQTQLMSAECPYLVHSLILSASFEQSKTYVASVRDKLMAQVMKLSLVKCRACKNH
jgi:hypothetical protein